MTARRLVVAKPRNHEMKRRLPRRHEDAKDKKTRTDRHLSFRGFVVSSFRDDRLVFFVVFVIFVIFGGERDDRD